MTADEHRAARTVAQAVSGTAPAQLPRHLCAAVREALGADGVTLALLTDTPSRQLLAASDATALRLEQIQFTVLEGPCISAAATGEPVLVRDLHGAPTPWPLFGATMREQLPQVRSVYAFPLFFGDYVLGSLDVLACHPHTLAEDVAEQGQDVADAVAEALFRVHTKLLTGDEPPDWEPAGIVRAHWFDTFRAIGVLAARQGVTTEDALALMRARAFGTGRTLADITTDILGGPTAT
ncbi:GAF and ANTAR domain-containing protein [Streptomyces sp. TG1A-8]|uniref:GAF and ANTAR domain-containing protein n=1 Tax=Streptomyces sp. TG1A-8 TaxID=3051385 RepID=UPI00265C8A15|nr:GAF and ANTAR domain-containing protein [Streptomyces sp. TG1A-8]MDO0925731.1 GAF and ANTAR domain-containing protein [Streptomyces sp. TG1A-8]